jgi:hypothetical protein
MADLLNSDLRVQKAKRPDQPFGIQYFLMLSPSVLNSTSVPRN